MIETRPSPRVERHFRQHPHRHRAGATLRHRLGGPVGADQVDWAAAGVPWYAYDTVTFSGEVTAVNDGLITVKVVGRNTLGDHVTATVELSMRDS